MHDANFTCSKSALKVGNVPRESGRHVKECGCLIKEKAPTVLVGSGGE
jgi:hypothetical protein